MNKNLNVQVRLSAQRALLGQVPLSLRSVSVDINEHHVYFRCIFDGNPTEYDWELTSVAATEIIADFQAPYVIEEEYLSIEEPNEMKHLKYLIYLRHENKNIKIMHPKTAARQLALRALMRSESNDMVAPDFAIWTRACAHFARELYSGTQRNRARLDWTLAPLLSKPIAKLDAPIRAALRLAAYEKLVLQTPPHGFVGEYAGLMRDERKESAVGFVNAVARRIPGEWRVAPTDLPQQLAIEFSHPQWLVQRYIKALGGDEARQLLNANNQRAPLCLRANTLKISRDGIAPALA